MQKKARHSHSHSHTHTHGQLPSYLGANHSSLFLLWLACLLSPLALHVGLLLYLLHPPQFHALMNDVFSGIASLLSLINSLLDSGLRMREQNSLHVISGDE
jgi:hypothetical protein